MKRDVSPPGEVRRRVLRIIRFRINAKAHSLRRSSSPHPTRCRWAWRGAPDLFHHTVPSASMLAFPGPFAKRCVCPGDLRRSCPGWSCAFAPGVTPWCLRVQKQGAISYKRLDVPADWCPPALFFAITGTFPIATRRFQYSELQRQRRKDAGSVRKHNRAGQEKNAAYRGKAGTGTAAPGIFGYFPSLESTAPQA